VQDRREGVPPAVHRVTSPGSETPPGLWPLLAEWPLVRPVRRPGHAFRCRSRSDPRRWLGVRGVPRASAGRSASCPSLCGGECRRAHLHSPAVARPPRAFRRLGHAEMPNLFRDVVNPVAAGSADIPRGDTRIDGGAGISKTELRSRASIAAACGVMGPGALDAYGDGHVSRDAGAKRHRGEAPEVRVYVEVAASVAPAVTVAVKQNVYDGDRLTGRIP
jgi:hypothetical protein